MTTTRDKPVHFKQVPFTNGSACGVETRRGVRYSLRVEGVTCPRCVKEIQKPATTVEGALERIKLHAHYNLSQDPAATHALLEALNALIPGLT